MKNNTRTYNMDMDKFLIRKVELAFQSFMENLQYLHRRYKENPFSFLEVKLEDADHISNRVISFLKGYAEDSGMKGYVVGLSGGLDSSVCADLAVKAVGKENVYGMLLPSKFTSQNHIDDALELSEMLGIRINDYEIVRNNFDKASELTMQMTEIEDKNPKAKIVLANNHARERMKILRGKAQELDRLVLGTTNMTEAWLGYATIAGDGYKGIDVEPLQMLPKTSERLYARFLGIPKQIIEKAPTAGLWDDQTDEDEIGMSYEDIDRIMTGYFLNKMHFEEGTAKALQDQAVENIIEANKKKTITKESIERIVNRAKRNAFKAKPEPYADLT